MDEHDAGGHDVAVAVETRPPLRGLHENLGAAMVTSGTLPGAPDEDHSFIPRTCTRPARRRTSAPDAAPRRYARRMPALRLASRLSWPPCCLPAVPLGRAPPCCRRLRACRGRHATATALVGAPYRDGGQDPSGFDCSGFVHYVFAQHGLAAPRDVRRQWQWGSRRQARGYPGRRPALLLDEGSGTAHVTLAIDAGRFVHAPARAAWCGSSPGGLLLGETFRGREAAGGAGPPRRDSASSGWVGRCRADLQAWRNQPAAPRHRRASRRDTEAVGHPHELATDSRASCHHARTVPFDRPLGSAEVEGNLLVEHPRSDLAEDRALRHREGTNRSRSAFPSRASPRAGVTVQRDRHGLQEALPADGLHAGILGAALDGSDTRLVRPGSSRRHGPRGALARRRRCRSPSAGRVEIEQQRSRTRRGRTP